MDPYGSLLSHDDGWGQINFFDKNEIFGPKRPSGQNFRFFAPSYHNVAYKGLISNVKLNLSSISNGLPFWLVNVIIISSNSVL